MLSKKYLRAVSALSDKILREYIEENLLKAADEGKFETIINFGCTYDHNCAFWFLEQLKFNVKDISGKDYHDFKLQVSW